MPESTDLPVRLGRALRTLRDARDLSQETLAGDAGISRTYLGEIERGTKCPSVCIVDALAQALGMRAYELLKVADDLDQLLPPSAHRRA
ncbi:MAG TPA: helix-turn-helix transcriptional regulator [Candidatus Dormibacteraeota bacterium]|jgi:transcriptional regulator with XRE-family HTH domain|nr:helix-turn-helix transcriptional regulator [Candidatus Dormibacteraeota bacterium]